MPRPSTAPTPGTRLEGAVQRGGNVIVQPLNTSAPLEAPKVVSRLVTEDLAELRAAYETFGVVVLRRHFPAPVGDRAVGVLDPAVVALADRSAHEREAHDSLRANGIPRRAL